MTRAAPDRQGAPGFTEYDKCRLPACSPLLLNNRQEARTLPGLSLAMGMVLSLLVAGPAAAVANALVWVGLALLVSIPVLTVVGVLIDEWRRRDWRFVLAGVAALCLLAFAIARKLPIWG